MNGVEPDKDATEEPTETVPTGSMDAAMVKAVEAVRRLYRRAIYEED